MTAHHPRLGDCTHSDTGQYVFVDTAVGGLEHRNHPMRVDEFNPPVGNLDTFKTFLQYGQQLVEHQRVIPTPLTYAAIESGMMAEGNSANAA